MYNPNSLDTICGALAYALGIEAPEKTEEPELSVGEAVEKTAEVAE